jgi:hypothetical protein
MAKSCATSQYTTRWSPGPASGRPSRPWIDAAMNLAENVRLALTALRANKLRSFLTMLGMIIGVAAVITLVSVGQGVEVFVAEQFQGLGNDLLFVFPGQIRPDGPPRQRRAGLTNDDVIALSDPLVVPDLVRVAPDYTRSTVVTRGRYETRTSITGTSPVTSPRYATFSRYQAAFLTNRITPRRPASPCWDRLSTRRSFPMGNRRLAR